ncbi:MAG: hypothetical protein KC613_26215, partial [Myxococcales bacterium]|nr:hypothetical protein [Myxococcales bacterium]
AEAEAEAAPAADPQAERLSAQHAAWRARLAREDGEADEALRVLVVDLLRQGDRRTLAKAVMLFPEAFPKAFPIGGEFASAKFELAEYLKHAEPAALPSDGEFFDKLDRYALSAALTAHPDTELIRSLHDDFGPAALVDAVQRLPARHGALLFAVAPEAMQREAVRQLDPRVLAAGVDQLFRSNRMDPDEVDYLLAVLGALKAGEPVPKAPADRPVSDRGSAFDAPGALSVMLPMLSPETRQALVQHALQRHAGHLPGWTRDTLYGEMLLRLPEEGLRDLLLEVPLAPLAAWLRTQTEATAAALKQRAPNSLRAALDSLAAPPSEGALLALAQEARGALSASLLKRLGRSDTPFHALLA